MDSGASAASAWTLPPSIPLGRPSTFTTSTTPGSPSGTADPVSIFPTVGRDKMVFSMIETTGTIWMATLDKR